MEIRACAYIKFAVLKFLYKIMGRGLGDHMLLKLIKKQVDLSQDAQSASTRQQSSHVHDYS